MLTDLAPAAPILTMDKAPAALVCGCKDRLVFAIDNDITGPRRVDILYRAATTLGWVELSQAWHCARCWAGQVAQAALELRAGSPKLHWAVQAAEKTYKERWRVAA